MTQKRRKGDFREWKIQNLSRGSSPHTQLEACAFGAHLGNPSVCFLDPRPELAQVLHEKWGHLMLFPPSFESREPFRWMNHWKQQPASDYESISVFSQNRQHAENIFPNVREIFAVLPMESTEVERPFSFMRRILTWLRIIMIMERLSDLAVIATYAYAVTIHSSVVCKKFVALQPRRMTASSLFDEASISSILGRFKTLQC